MEEELKTVFCPVCGAKLEKLSSGEFPRFCSTCGILLNLTDSKKAKRMSTKELDSTARRESYTEAETDHLMNLLLTIFLGPIGGHLFYQGKRFSAFCYLSITAIAALLGIMSAAVDDRFSDILYSPALGGGVDISDILAGLGWAMFCAVGVLCLKDLISELHQMSIEHKANTHKG